MLDLRKINKSDIKKEYKFLQELTPENGFTNNNYGLTYEVFLNEKYPMLKDIENGINLAEGYVPQTIYFLWNDNQIVGIFKLRHYLNDALREGAGHIGFAIHKDYRDKGYATKGLSLTLKEALTIVREDEIIMSCNKTNIGSRKAQENNGAHIFREDDDHYYLKIHKKDIKGV